MKVVLLALSLALTVEAEDPLKLPELSTNNGHVYRDVTVTSVDPAGIKIMHSSGIAKLPFEVLPEELRTKLGYNPEKAQEFAAKESVMKQGAAKAAELSRLKQRFAAEAKKRMVTIQGKVLQVLGDRLILTDAKQITEDRHMSLPDNAACVICNTQGLVDGSYVKEELYPADTFQYSTVLGGVRTIRCYYHDLQDYMEWISKK